MARTSCNRSSRSGAISVVVKGTRAPPKFDVGRRPGQRAGERKGLEAFSCGRPGQRAGERKGLEAFSCGRPGQRSGVGARAGGVLMRSPQPTRR